MDKNSSEFALDGLLEGVALHVSHTYEAALFTRDRRLAEKTINVITIKRGFSSRLCLKVSTLDYALMEGNIQIYIHGLLLLCAKLVRRTSMFRY